MYIPNIAKDVLLLKIIFIFFWNVSLMGILFLLGHRITEAPVKQLAWDKPRSKVKANQAGVSLDL